MSISPLAVVNDSARIGAEVSIGPFVVIEADAEIGDRTTILARASIKRFTTLGIDNRIHEGAIIGGEPQDASFVDCESYVRIGDRNRIREGVTIHRGTHPSSQTVIGSDCFLMACSHVAHDCRLDDGIILANNVALAGHVEIGERAFLSGGVVVHQFCRIGKLAMIGGNSKIVQDCLPFVITDGVPGSARGLNVVGLKRAGVKASQLRNLKEAYRILLRSGLPLEQAADRLAEIGDPLVTHLAEFARTSERGFAR